MGTCSSIRSLTISLEKENLTYFTDEIICGTICWNTNGDKIRNQQILLKLIGEIGFTKNTFQQLEYHHEQFYSIPYPIIKPTDNSSFQGIYSWSFQFPLLNHLPPTLSKPEFYPHVKYYLYASIQQSHEKHTKFINVYPRIVLTDNCEYLSSKIFANYNEIGIILKCTMNRLGFVPGDLIEFMLDIDNPNEFSIEFIDLFIFQFYEIYSNKSRNMIFHTTLPNIQYLQSKLIADAFSIPIPAIQLPPSTQFHGGIQTVFTVKQSYQLKFIMKIQNYSSDLQLDIPIVIATQIEPCSVEPKSTTISIVPSAPTLEQILLNDDDDDNDFIH